MSVPFYRYSFETAQQGNEIEKFRASYAENQRCCNYIMDSETGLYAKAYKDYCVDSDGAYTKSLIKEFGLERLMYVYSSTVRRNMNDRRITDEIKDWAKNFNIGVRDESSCRDFDLYTINPGIVDILAKKAIEEYKNLKLFDESHCEEEFEELEGKVLVISPKRLKEEYWSPENQLWYATGGYGCHAFLSGRAVHSICLSDGEETRWDRGDFIGVIKDECIPDWAKEKLRLLKGEQQSANQENELNLS